MFISVVMSNQFLSHPTRSLQNVVSNQNKSSTGKTSQRIEDTSYNDVFWEWNGSHNTPFSLALSEISVNKWLKMFWTNNCFTGGVTGRENFGGKFDNIVEVSWFRGRRKWRQKSPLGAVMVTQTLVDGCKVGQHTLRGI